MVVSSYLKEKFCVMELSAQDNKSAIEEIAGKLASGGRLADKDKLKLITKRELLTHNSWLHNFEPFMGPKRKTNYLFMNPKDAKARGIAEDDKAEIASSAGKVTIPVKFTEDLMPGVVAFPHGWGHKKAQGLNIARKHPGINANLLTADGIEGCEYLSGMTHMTGIKVEVNKVKPRPKNKTKKKE